jgi:hypothetical protein
MSFGFLANPPVTLLPVFSEASFDYSTSSTSTIDTVLLQAQTDEVYTDASAQSVVLADIGQIISASSSSGSGTIGTNQTLSYSTLNSGSYYAISFAFNFIQTNNALTLRALTLQDNFGNIYDAGRATLSSSVKSCSILSNKLYVGSGSPFTLTIYSQYDVNGGAYDFDLRLNILKIK